MFENEKISVIIPTFNRASLLERALISVANQTYKPFEVIVVDDGSDEENRQSTKTLVESWRTRLPVKFIQTENRGVSAARNTAASHATGSWLAFLDSDDEWLPEKLSKQIEFSHQNPSFSLIHSEEIWVRNGVRVNATKKYKKQGGWAFLNSLPQCCISPSTVLVKSDYFKDFKGFRETFPVCEDYDLWLRMTLKKQVGLVDEPLVIKYGGHQDQLSQKLKAMDYYRVLAINDILKEDFSVQQWREQARHTLLNKCDVLLNGYIKHKNMNNYSEILAIKERWQ